MLTSKMHLSTIFATPLCSSNIRNALTHSSCWAFMSRMIWSGRGMLMPFCPRPHLHCTSWSSGDEQGSNEMTCCASMLAWYRQCWNTHVRHGTKALQLHRPRHWSHYSRGRWGSSFKTMTICCHWSKPGLTRSSLGASIWLSASSNEMCWGSHPVYIICWRTNARHLSRTNCAIPKLLNYCQLELLNFLILLYLSVHIIMIRPCAVAHYEFFLLLHVTTVSLLLYNVLYLVTLISFVLIQLLWLQYEIYQHNL